MPTVKIPSQLRAQTDNQSQVKIDGTKVSEVLENLVQQYPSLKEKLYNDTGKLHRYVNVYLGDEDVRFLDYLDTTVTDDSELSLVPAIAGGC